MNKINIKSAGLEDLEILLTFEQAVIHAERLFDETLKEGNINYYDIREMILDPYTEVAIAVSGTKIVGSGYAKIVESKPYYIFDKYAYLGFMYTDFDYRGQGINSSIIEFLKKWCISKNISEMRLDVYETNLSAIKAYEKFGFKKDMVNMRIGL